MNSEIKLFEDEICGEYINGFKGKILWANENPTNEFSGQNITLNNDDYDSYTVICRFNTGSNLRIISSGLILKGYGTIISSNIDNGTYMSISKRQINFTNNTTINIADCYSCSAGSLTINKSN